MSCMGLRRLKTHKKMVRYTCKQFRCFRNSTLVWFPYTNYDIPKRGCTENNHFDTAPFYYRFKSDIIPTRLLRWVSVTYRSKRG